MKLRDLTKGTKLLYNSNRIQRVIAKRCKHLPAPCFHGYTNHMAKGLKLKPTAGYVLLEPQEAERKTASGILLPDTAGEKPQIGKVIAVGGSEITASGKKKSAPVKVGNLVVYKKWGGNEIRVENKDYLFVKFEDILAVKTA